MAKNGIVAKIFIKVHLVTGKTIAHEYNPPTSEKEMKQFVNKMVDRMAILCRGDDNYLYFENPSVSYNPDNVICIEFSIVGADELKIALEKAQRKAGFVPARS